MKLSFPLAVGVTMLSASVLSGCTTTNISTETRSMSSVKIVETVTEWWQGDYSNEKQIAALREDGVPIWQQGKGEEHSFGGYLPVNSYYRAVDMPEFGENVLYLEEKTFGEDPYRQRIYTIKHDQETDTVRVKLWYFKDKKSHLNSWNNLENIQGLTKEDFSPLPDNCDLVVKPEDNGRLHMMMPKDQCKFGTKIFDYQVSLGPDDFWFRDRIVDANTMIVSMTAGSFGYHKLDKS